MESASPSCAAPSRTPFLWSCYFLFIYLAHNVCCAHLSILLYEPCTLLRSLGVFCGYLIRLLASTMIAASFSLDCSSVKILLAYALSGIHATGLTPLICGAGPRTCSSHCASQQVAPANCRCEHSHTGSPFILEQVETGDLTFCSCKLDLGT